VCASSASRPGRFFTEDPPYRCNNREHTVRHSCGFGFGYCSTVYGVRTVRISSYVVDSAELPERDDAVRRKMSAIGTSLNPQPPSYRLAVVNNNHMTSRQSKTVHPRPEMTSRDVQRVASRGVDRAVPSPRSATATQGWICDDERVRLMLGANVVDRDSVLAGYQCSTVRSSRPTTAATAFSLPREVSYDRGQDRAAGSTARSRLFSPAPYQFHESSYSAPADCTALRKPHPYVPSARLPCRSGVRAAIVSERTKYHLTSTTRRPTVTSSSGKDGQSSRSSSESQQGASLWVGVAQIVDVRPVSAKAITATVDHDSSKLCISYRD